MLVSNNYSFLLFIPISKCGWEHGRSQRHKLSLVADKDQIHNIETHCHNWDLTQTKQDVRSYKAQNAIMWRLLSAVETKTRCGPPLCTEEFLQSLHIIAFCSSGVSLWVCCHKGMSPNGFVLSLCSHAYDEFLPVLTSPGSQGVVGLKWARVEHLRQLIFIHNYLLSGFFTDIIQTLGSIELIFLFYFF